MIEPLAEVPERFATPSRRAGAVGVGAPGLVDDTGVLRFAPNLPAATARHRRRTLGASRWPADRGGQRRHVRHAGGMGVRGRGGGRRRRDGHARHRHRRRRHRGRPRGAGGNGLRGGDRPHGGRPHRSSVPVRQAGLLGAIRLGERSRAPGPRGGPCRASRCGREPRRWGCGVGEGRTRVRRPRPETPARWRCSASSGGGSPSALGTSRGPRPRRHGVRRWAGRDHDLVHDKVRTAFDELLEGHAHRPE